jgi:hypothetical protein
MASIHKCQKSKRFSPKFKVLYAATKIANAGLCGVFRCGCVEEGDMWWRVVTGADRWWRAVTVGRGGYGSLRVVTGGDGWWQVVTGGASTGGDRWWYWA